MAVKRYPIERWRFDYAQMSVCGIVGRMVGNAHREIEQLCAIARLELRHGIRVL